MSSKSIKDVLQNKLLLGLTDHEKEEMRDSAFRNLDGLLAKQHWTQSEAGRIYIYAMLPPQVLPVKEQSEFISKYQKKMIDKTLETLTSNDLVGTRIYDEYSDLFKWLTLALEKSRVCTLSFTCHHFALYDWIQTALRCEHILSEVSLEGKKNYLYDLSLDRFMFGKSDVWEKNMENFKNAVSSCYMFIKALLYYNKTINIMREDIDIKEMSLLFSDVNILIDKVKSLKSLLDNFKRDIDSNKIKYIDKAENSTKKAMADKLLNILAAEESPDWEAWVLVDLLDKESFFEFLKEGLRQTASIKGFYNA